MSNKTAYLTVSRCRNHPFNFAVSLDTEEGVGTRLSPNKCCGWWEDLVKWAMTPKELREIVNTIECQIEDLETG